MPAWACPILTTTGKEGLVTWRQGQGEMMWQDTLVCCCSALHVCPTQGEVALATTLLQQRCQTQRAEERLVAAKVASLSGDCCRAKPQPQDGHVNGNKRIEAGGLKVSTVWKRLSRSLFPKMREDGRAVKARRGETTKRGRKIPSPLI